MPKEALLSWITKAEHLWYLHSHLLRKLGRKWDNLHKNIFSLINAFSPQFQDNKFLTLQYYLHVLPHTTYKFCATRHRKS